MHRCEWSNGSPVMQAYHDKEWGVPVHSDRALFEFVVLESAQAGLSWSIVLNRREHYREAFADFAPDRVAAFTDEDVERCLTDSGIIRNRAKVLATISNARAFLQIQDEFGSFDRYM